MIRRVSHILIKRACFFGVFALAVMLSLFFVGCDPNGPDHIHDWGDWVETTPATCTAPGVETRICKENANHTETRSIAQLSGSQCGSGNGGDDSFTDTRNSQTYKTVKIGNQTWMAENLNYAGSGGNTGVCYNSSSDNCSKYGRLYTWAEVMNGASSSLLNPSGVQGVCPVGWHVPSDAEWTILTDFVGGDLTAGTKLKSKTGWGSYQGISST
ncbi:MAG: hypothetical protein LBB56_04515, partial [Chitinispirillales bacterium]|nr:hypothetical protein [Chitinispirillales bacterium]